MKRKKLLDALLLAMLCMFSFTACSSDDDDDKNDDTEWTGGGKNTPSGLAGTWHGSHNFGNIAGTRHIYFTFDNDMTGRFSIEAKSFYAAAAFTYSVSGNQITCNGICYTTNNDGETDVDYNWKASFELKNGKLTAKSPYSSYGELTKQ